MWASGDRRRESGSLMMAGIAGYVGKRTRGGGVVDVKWV